MDLGDGARLDALRVVDQVLGRHAELAVQKRIVERGHPHQVGRAVFGEARRDARSDAPDVGDGPMPPDLLAKQLLVEVPDAVVDVLRRDIERHLGQEQIGADARGGADAAPREHGVHELARELAGGLVVQGQIGRRIDEAFVDGVHVDVVGADELEVDAVDLRGDLHVVAHARLGHDVVDALGDLEHAAAVAHAELLHGGRDRKADGRAPAVGVGHHEVAGERVAPAVGAFDGGVERLEVDAQVGFVFAFAPRHRFPSRSNRSN